MKRAIELIVVMAAALAGTTMFVSPASAAIPTCNTVKTLTNNDPDIKVPAYSGTGSTTCGLEQGNYNNAAVTELQKALNRCYYRYYGIPAGNFWPIAEDGDFGSKTREALRRAQAHHTSEPADIDGEYGPITRDLLDFRTAQGDGCWYVT
ncbi:peptidoglycan-binding domain-containing protein [Streptomyces cadmiisoli]|uniref:peptidoglycan-binding domain-containing protein n=1 Tax=Streptomyces cadmiisoli TaxID=2184053 RepID=UPI00365BA973